MSSDFSESAINTQELESDGYLSTFSLDTSVDPTLDIGTPYVSTDASGGVYVFDNPDFHQYLDASVVPEPSA